MTKLDWTDLHSGCDPTMFDFETTAELEDLEEIVGQQRAMAAIEFGIGMGGQGFNVFAMGPSGIGKHHVLTWFLDDRAPHEPTPLSWCYVHNLVDPGAPRAIALAAGQATRARIAIDSLLGEIEVAIRAVLEGDEFRHRRRMLNADAESRHEDALQSVADAAGERGLSLERTSGGFAIVPVIDDELAAPEAVLALPESEQQRLEDARDEVEALLRAALDDFPTWERERRHGLAQLQGDYVATAVGPLFERLREEFDDSDEFVDHIRLLEASLVRDPSPFLAIDDEEQDLLFAPHALGLERFTVNVVVDHDPGHGAPVIYEDDPTYETLHGRVEYDAAMGGLTTNFALIRSGSLHQANGGYLVVDAHKLLADPQSWNELKRTLYAEEIRVSSQSESALAPRALSLDPDPIPLSVKVILLGERETYYALRELDPDMDELFKVMADFDTEVPRTPDNVRAYARFIATIGRTHGIRPFDRSAVARVVEEGARIVGNARKLSTHMRSIADLLHASDYWAARDHAESVSRDHIVRALDEERRRNGRLRDALLEEVTEHLINVATTGEAVGEVNGLSVIHFGGAEFGRPARISAAVSPGYDIIDIEREVDLGGPIHSKGVMLLAGFLAHRYGSERPLALSATLAFEQSYTPVDGDSASAAEACALLSALSGAPLRQSLAMTGSLDQRGRIQAVGGVDAKIEGWFDVCAARGLTGDQGTLIPTTNATSLMLEASVIAAVREGKFSIHAVESIDDAMQLLTGLSPGELDDRVRARLAQFGEAWSDFRR